MDIRRPGKAVVTYRLLKGASTYVMRAKPAGRGAKTVETLLVGG